MTNTVQSLNLAGIQAAIFELVWPTFPWIHQIWLTKDGSAVSAYVQPTKEVPADWDDCVMLIQECLVAALPTDATIGAIVLRRQSTSPEGAVLIMSEAIFVAIAKEVAPWRLEAGR